MALTSREVADIPDETGKAQRPDLSSKEIPCMSEFLLFRV